MLKISNKVVYEGDYVEGKKHGKGIEINILGEKYEGEFQNDKKHGSGT